MQGPGRSLRLAASVTVALPDGSELVGTAAVVLGQVVVVDFQAPVAAQDDSLPRTGTDADALARLGLLLFIAGLFLLAVTAFVSRRPQREADA